MPLIVMEPRGGGNERDRMKKIEAPPSSTFRLGSKINCFSKLWLVTEVNYNEEIKLQGVMRLCNYVLKWQDDIGNIIEEPCVCSKYKTSATGEDSGKIVTINDTRRDIYIQFNEKTATLRQEMRHYIDLKGVSNPKVYRLTDLNRTSYIIDDVGCFQMTYEEDQKKPPDVDRDDLMIADYKEPSEPPLPGVGSCRIIFDGQPVLKAGGSPRQFIAEFLDDDGNVLDGIVPTWELMPVGDWVNVNQISILSQSENRIELQASSSAVVGSKVLLQMRADSADFGVFEASLELGVESLW